MASPENSDNVISIFSKKKCYGRRIKNITAIIKKDIAKLCYELSLKLIQISKYTLESYELKEKIPACDHEGQRDEIIELLAVNDHKILDLYKSIKHTKATLYKKKRNYINMKRIIL